MQIHRPTWSSSETRIGDQNGLRLVILPCRRRLRRLFIYMLLALITFSYSLNNQQCRRDKYNKHWNTTTKTRCWRCIAEKTIRITKFNEIWTAGDFLDVDRSFRCITGLRCTTMRLRQRLPSAASILLINQYMIKKVDTIFILKFT